MIKPPTVTTIPVGPKGYQGKTQTNIVIKQELSNNKPSHKCITATLASSSKSPTSSELDYVPVTTLPRNPKKFEDLKSANLKLAAIQHAESALSKSLNDTCTTTNQSWLMFTLSLSCKQVERTLSPPNTIFHCSTNAAEHNASIFE